MSAYLDRYESPFAPQYWRPTRKNPSTCWLKWNGLLYLIGKNKRGFWVRIQSAENGDAGHFLPQSYMTFGYALAALETNQQAAIHEWMEKLFEADWEEAIKENKWWGLSEAEESKLWDEMMGMPA